MIPAPLEPCAPAPAIPPAPALPREAIAPAPHDARPAAHCAAAIWAAARLGDRADAPTLRPGSRRP